MARSEAAYLRDTRALSQLSLALGKFATGVQEAMTQTDAEIRRTQEWLEERARYWHQQVVQARQEVQAAQHALHRCQRSVRYDRDGRPIPPDCSAEIAHLSYCRRRLQQAEEELRTVKKWQAKIEQAISQYQNSAKRMRGVATTSTKKSQSFLNQKITEIEKYSSPRSVSGSAVSKPPEQGITWSEMEAIIAKIDNGEPITPEDISNLSKPIIDLQSGTVAENESWIQGIINAEKYRDAMRDSAEAENLRDALLAALKAINYWRSK
jgi:hypothetical protein